MFVYPNIGDHFFRGITVVLNRSSPDYLLSKPAGIALVKPVLVGGFQLLKGSNVCSNILARLDRPLVVQVVPAGVCPVVKHHTCQKKKKKESRYGSR